MGRRRELDPEPVTGPNRAAFEHDGHDAGCVWVAPRLTGTTAPTRDAGSCIPHPSPSYDMLIYYGQGKIIRT
jgi:hypothetical protein